MKGKKAPAPKGKIVAKAVMADAKAAGKSPFEVKATKGDMEPEGSFGKRRLDRPGRKHGGRVGADVAPLKTTRC
jgi:hypothetical protein